MYLYQSQRVIKIVKVLSDILSIIEKDESRLRGKHGNVVANKMGRMKIYTEIKDIIRTLQSQQQVSNEDINNIIEQIKTKLTSLGQAIRNDSSRFSTHWFFPANSFNTKNQIEALCGNALIEQKLKTAFYKKFGMDKFNHAMALPTGFGGELSPLCNREIRSSRSLCGVTS